jgi:hypothetical protein
LLLTWIVALLPAALYTWLYLSYLQVIQNKRDELKQILARGGAISKYVSAYGNKDDNSEIVASRLIIRNNYARMSYLRALVFTALVTTLAAVIGLARAGFPTGLPAIFTDFLKRSNGVPALLAGCAGAFVWGLYELLRRYRVGDLTPAAIYFTGIRTLVLAGVGPALSTVLKSEFSWAIAFGLGVIPLNTIADIAAQPTRKALGLAAPVSATVDPLITSVQGLTPEIFERIQEAGINNVQQLAFSDPLRLLVRTNLDWKVILDLLDQSFLAVYVGPRINDLRSMGVRGAVELCGIRNNQLYPELLQSISKILGRSPEEVRCLMDTLGIDPTTAFISELWS